MKFKNGDVVSLKSGGPEMTIDIVEADRGRVSCSWFVGNRLEQKYFLAETLVKIADDQHKILFDKIRRILVYQGKTIILTPHEAMTVDLFLRCPNITISHAEIVSLVSKGNRPENPADITRPLISRLKEKLKSIPGGEEWIQSVRGTGYLFVKEIIQ